MDRGLSAREAAAALGWSHTKVLRIERARSPRVAARDLHSLAAAVGLDVSMRTFPGAGPVRDAAHVRLLARFRACLPATLRWATEVPLPMPGDQRAWDALISGNGWRFGIEAETGPRDAQALVRRLNLKARDGGVQGVVLVLPDTRRTRAFLREAAAELRPALPCESRPILGRLAAGLPPAGNGIVVI